MPLFRTQSAAERTSHAPHDSKARLRVISNSRGSWRSHVHRTCIVQRVQSFKLQTRNVRGQGARPLAFSWGFKGAILSRERMTPLVLPRLCRISLRTHAEKKSILSHERMPFFCFRSKKDQNAHFSRRKSLTSLMGIRTCSMLSRSRTVTQWSAAMPLASSPTVSKSNVMQYGVPISSSRR